MISATACRTIPGFLLTWGVILIVCSMPVSAQGLLASWTFSGNANDATGNGHNGTVYNATLVEDRFGTANSAYYFNGTNAYIRVPHATVLNGGSPVAMTLSVWIKTCEGAYDNKTVVVGKGSQTNEPQYGIGIRTLGSNNVYYAGVQPGSLRSNTNAAVGTRIDDGRWHHIAAMFVDSLSSTGTTVKLKHWLYVDGVLQGSFSHSQAGCTYCDYSSNLSDLIIGKNDVLNLFFKGAIDDVSFYNRDLSASEVQALYAQGNWPLNRTVSLTVQALDQGTICPEQTVRLQASGDANRYEWFQDPTLSDRNVPNPVARPKVTTTYKVRAFKANSGFPCPDSIVKVDSVTVTVYDAPKVNLDDTRYLCPGSRITIGDVATGGLPPYRYAWYPGAGLSDSTAPRPTATVNKSTMYWLTVTDARGCQTKDSILLVAYPAVKFDAGPDTSMCRGTPITIGGDASGNNGPFQYHWSPKTGLSDTNRGKVIARPDSTTRYYVEVKDVSTGCMTYDTILVTVKDAAHADAGADAVICTDSSAVIGMTAETGYEYLWTPADGLSDPTGSKPTASPTTTTTYYLTATNAAGCEARDSVTITVLKPALTVDKQQLDFGRLDGCTSTKELELILRNTGENDLRVTDVTSAGFSIVSPARPINLKVGASAKVVVRYSPAGSGATNGTLVLHGEPCGVEVVVDLTGSKDQSDISASVPNIDFGQRLACEKLDSTIEVTITNSSGTNATLKAPIVNAPFSATSASTIVAAGQTVKVQVSYKPTAAGTYSDDLKIPYESGTCRDTLRIALSGLVEQPTLTPDAGMIDFGTLSGCETGRDTTITLHNDGVFDITINGNNLPSGYKIVGAAPTVIRAGKSVTLQLRYEPVASGPSSGNLVLSFEPCDSELRIPVNGSKQGVSFAMPDTIDFGQLIDCREQNKMQKLTISYSGDAGTSGTIRSVAITGPFTITMKAGSALNNGAPTTFDVTFTPTADGAATGYVDLVLEPCGIAKRIALRGTRATAKLTAQPLNFGTQPSGTIVSLPVLYVNTGTTPLRIDNIDGITAPFAITGTTPATPLTLQPGDTIRVDVRYTATSGQSIDTVLAHIGQPCAIISSAEVRGTGESGAAAVIALPTITAAAGQHIYLPLLLQSSSNLDGVNARNFTAVISFNRSLLIPVEKLGMSVDATTRRVTVTGTRGATDTLAAVPMTVLLGTAPTTPLKLESLQWTDATGEVATTLVDGVLNVSDICYIGGARLIDGSGEIVLKPATPNPATGMVEIEYAIVEDGLTQLYVVDASGQRVATVIDAPQPGGRYVAQLETGKLAIGSYFCVLRTATQMLVQKLEVRK